MAKNMENEVEMVFIQRFIELLECAEAYKITES